MGLPSRITVVSGQATHQGLCTSLLERATYWKWNQGIFARSIRWILMVEAPALTTWGKLFFGQSLPTGRAAYLCRTLSLYRSRIRVGCLWGRARARLSAGVGAAASSKTNWRFEFGQRSVATG